MEAGPDPAGNGRYFFFRMLCGLRLPIRPLSEPDAGSITALIRAALPESTAAFTARLTSSGGAALTARLNSSGVLALTRVPPNASIILSQLDPLTKTVGATSEPPVGLTSV